MGLQRVRYDWVTSTRELTGRCKKQRGSNREFQRGTHFIIRLVSVLTSFKSVTSYLRLHLGEGKLCWMKTDSGSLRRLSSWFHLFWKTKYGQERFLLNCCSVYTDWLLVSPWTAACQVPLSFTISQSLFKFMPMESVMPSKHLILCRPFFLLPWIFPRISLFQWVSSSHQVAKVLDFQLQQQSFQQTFRVDFL